MSMSAQNLPAAEIGATAAVDPTTDDTPSTLSVQAHFLFRLRRRFPSLSFFASFVNNDTRFPLFGIDSSNTNTTEGRMTSLFLPVF